MARFIFPGKYAMRPLKPQKGKGKKKSKILAYFNVVDTKIGIEFRDARLIEGENGVFVSSPFRTYENNEGDTKYSNFWQAAYDEDTEARSETGVAYLEEMAEAAYAKYLEVSEGGDDEEDEKPRRKKGTKSARGPIRPKVDEEEDDEEEEEEEELEEDDEEEEKVQRPRARRRSPF